MDYPFINAKELTDDQLMDRIQKCYRILSGEAAMGHNTIVQSARAQLETYQFEWNERMQTRAMQEQAEKDKEKGPLEFGVVDEYYKPDDKNKDEE